MKLRSLGINPDTLTLDSFVLTLNKLDALRLWQSGNEQERNALGIAALQRKMEIAKAAGASGPFDGPDNNPVG